MKDESRVAQIYRDAADQKVQDEMKFSEVANTSVLKATMVTEELMEATAGLGDVRRQAEKALHDKDGIITGLTPERDEYMKACAQLSATNQATHISLEQMNHAAKKKDDDLCNLSAALDDITRRHERFAKAAEDQVGQMRNFEAACASDNEQLRDHPEGAVKQVQTTAVQHGALRGEVDLLRAQCAGFPAREALAADLAAKKTLENA